MDNSNITHPTDVKQRSWDQPCAVVNAEFNALMGRQTEAYHRPRLMAAAAAEHSGDLLNALPITSCGLRLDNEALRVACIWDIRCVSCISVLVVPWWTHAVHTHFHADSVRVDKLVIIISTISYIVRAGDPATKEPKGLSCFAYRC
jgi:hypothetical protein